jgi:tetratricopeptide (TPR) repeat protein
VLQGQLQQYTSAMNYYSQAIEFDHLNPFYYFNRSAINSEMTDFVSSIDNSVQTIVLDNSGIGRAKAKQEIKVLNYSDAIADLNKVLKLMPDFAYAYYNRGNLNCLSQQMPEAINDYTKAIELYPYFAEAYFNRGLVQIYLKDTEKGCIDISKSGELGIEDAYAIIKKFCKTTD